jgi:predicted O-methyltransferase YrrM
MKKLLKIIYNKLFGTGTKKRYSYLTEAAAKYKPKRIMEIGVFNGENSLRIINEALKNGAVEYYGFDLFDELSEDKFSMELAKHPHSMSDMQKKLDKTGAKITLIKGDTNKTLPEAAKSLPKMDLIFIDGGHSLETINNDWLYSEKMLADNGAIIFDDYWNRTDAGCKPLIDALDRNKYDITIIPTKDRHKKEWGILEINLAEVKKK